MISIKKMYLDDLRTPKNASEWIILRTYDDAVNHIIENGVPEHISFDHDLGDEFSKTGYDFVKWLVEYDIEHDVLPKDFTFEVHSANPPGAKNIKMLISNYISYKYGLT